MKKIFGALMLLLIVFGCAGPRQTGIGPNMINGCANITAPGYYTVVNSFTVNADPCILITASNVTLDCQGYTITGINNSGQGGTVRMSDQHNVVVENCVLTNVSEGIQFRQDLGSPYNNSMINNSVSSTFAGGSAGGTFGLDIVRQANASIINNTINYTNSDAIRLRTNLFRDYSILFYGNNIYSQNWAGVEVEGSANTTFQNNIVNSNFYCWYEADTLNSANLTFINNSCISRSYPALSLLGCAGSNFTLNSFTGAGTLPVFQLYSCPNVTVANNTFTTSSQRGALVYLDINSGRGLFYYNHFGFTNSVYVNDANGTSQWNTTVNGTAQGNYWDNVIAGDVIIGDCNGDGWGDCPPNYPYNSTFSLGKLVGKVTDWGPRISPYFVIPCYISPGVAPVVWPILNPPSHIYVGARPLRQGIYGTYTCIQNATNISDIYARLNTTLQNTTQYVWVYTNNSIGSIPTVINISEVPALIYPNATNGTMMRISMGRDYFDTRVPLLSADFIVIRKSYAGNGTG